MKISLGADHNGMDFKQMLSDHLKSAGHEVLDVGPSGTDSVDYPDFAFAAAEMVSNQPTIRGGPVDSRGIGISMAANKVPGVRAALCFTPESAALTRQHNDANVLALAGWQSDGGDVLEIVDTFLATDFEGGRHARRVDKIIAYEQRRGQK